MPRMGSSNTLGNVGSLLQNAVGTTEDIALRTVVGKNELSGLTPAMRMAIMKNRIMKSALARTNTDSGEEEEEESPHSAGIDSGLVTTERSRKTQVRKLINQLQGRTKPR